MATTGTISAIYTHLFGTPKSTATHIAQQLRADKRVLRTGKQGPNAIDLKTHEVANWTIALCAATSVGMRKSPDVLQMVKLARRAPRFHAESSPGFLDGLRLEHASTFGAAIDGLLDDLRSGAFHSWKGDTLCTPVIRFYDCASRIFLNLSKITPAGTSTSAALVFRTEDHAPLYEGRFLTSIAQLDGFSLSALADALGPPD